MIQLNLLPAKVRNAQRMRTVLLAAGIVYGVAALVLGWQWGRAKARLARAERETARVQAQLDSPELQEAVKAVQKFADGMAAMKAKASVVNSLRAQQVPLLRVLDLLPDWTLDGQVWFNEIVASDAAGRENITLSASALSRVLFARYFDFLDGQPLVLGLALQTAPSDAMVYGIKSVQFKLTFAVEDPK